MWEHSDGSVATDKRKAIALLEWRLADIWAKRRILDEVVDEANGLDMQVDGEFRVGRRDETAEPYLGDVLLQLLALPYADRPGYREEWRLAERL